jgi:AcrR family transcriptional regulator
LERDGPAGFNTNRIAERAGVSVGSVYQYFSNKHAILAAAARRALMGEAVLASAKLRALLDALISVVDSLGAEGGASRPPTGSAQQAVRGSGTGLRRERRGSEPLNMVAAWVEWLIAPQYLELIPLRAPSRSFRTLPRDNVG